MMSFAWLLDILVAIILAVAAINATRLGTIWLTTDRLLATGPTGPARRRVVRAEQTLASRTC